MTKPKKIGREQVGESGIDLFIYTSFQLETEQKAGHRWTAALLERVNGNFLQQIAFCYKRFVKPGVPKTVGIFFNDCFTSEF
jgi:hypothetical protein